MLTRIKAIWSDCKLGIIAVALAAAYLIGIKRGKNEEKVHQDKAVLADISRANRARNSLDDADVVRRLHNKYRRR